MMPKSDRNPFNPPLEYNRDQFLISTDPALLDLDAIHAFLTRSYWAEGITREVVARSIEHSLCFGVYDAGRQVGFARVISDYATYAYLADVFILESHRGRELAKWLMECVLKHPGLQGLRRWTLATRDAHRLYAQFGFAPLQAPDRFMEIYNREVYRKPKS
jgi:GNAT superfamily N-acetyltransferase